MSNVIIHNVIIHVEREPFDMVAILRCFHEATKYRYEKSEVDLYISNLSPVRVPIYIDGTWVGDSVYTNDSEWVFVEDGDDEDEYEEDEDDEDEDEDDEDEYEEDEDDEDEYEEDEDED